VCLRERSTGSILVLITLGLELAKMVKQENALSNQLILTGASLGIEQRSNYSLC